MRAAIVIGYSLVTTYNINKSHYLNLGNLDMKRHSRRKIKMFYRNKRQYVNVDIFALYIFSRNSRFLNIRENMCSMKIT